MCIVSESCGKSGQSQERDNALQSAGQTESLMHVFFLCSADCSKKGNGTLSIKQEVKALILSWLRYRWHKKEYNRIFRQLNHKSLFTRLRIIGFSSMHRHVCETKGYLSTPQETVHQNWKSRKQTVPCSAVTDASYNCLICLLFLATKNDPNSW